MPFAPETNAFTLLSPFLAKVSRVPREREARGSLRRLQFVNFGDDGFQIGLAELRMHWQ